MDPLALLLSMPTDMETWLISGYVVTVVAGARIFELLARLHFERARRYADLGFKYDRDLDHYQCPEGERLSLHLVEDKDKLAVYRAPASSCNRCPQKASCTPHDEGRHIYRPLAAWAETDIGQFHQKLSLLMFMVAAIFCVIGLVRGWAQPGTGLLLVALGASLASLIHKAGLGTRRDTSEEG